MPMLEIKNREKKKRTHSETTYSFVHSANVCPICYIPGTIPDTKNRLVSKTVLMNEKISLINLTMQCEELNKIENQQV